MLAFRPRESATSCLSSTVPHPPWLWAPPGGTIKDFDVGQQALGPLAGLLCDDSGILLVRL